MELERYVRQQNIYLLRKQAAETDDPAKRERILKLLAEEEAKSFEPTMKAAE